MFGFTCVEFLSIFANTSFGYSLCCGSCALLATSPLMDREKPRDPCGRQNGCVRLNLRTCEIPSSGPAPCRAGIGHHDQRIAHDRGFPCFINWLDAWFPGEAGDTNQSKAFIERFRQSVVKTLRRFQQWDLDSKLPALQIRSDMCHI